MDIVRKSFLALILAFALVFSLTPERVFGIGPQLEVFCGNWNYIKDSSGSYRELDALAIYGYAGSKFNYEVKFYNTVKSRRSLGIFKGSHEIKEPESETHTTEVPLNMKFNKSTSSIMYKSKYIRAELKFTDIQGFESYHRCTWKWN